MQEWRTTFPAAADRIRNGLSDRVAQIDRGEIAQARTALEDPGWRIGIDLTGVPLCPLARLDECAEQTTDSLADWDLGSAIRRTYVTACRQPRLSK